MRHMLKAADGCYTLSEQCTHKLPARTPIPAKFSPEDPYASYRRKARREHLEAEGLL